MNNLLTIHTSLDSGTLKQMKVAYEQGPKEDDKTDAVSCNDDPKAIRLDELLDNGKKSIWFKFRKSRWREGVREDRIEAGTY